MRLSYIRIQPRKEFEHSENEASATEAAPGEANKSMAVKKNNAMFVRIGLVSGIDQILHGPGGCFSIRCVLIDRFLKMSAIFVFPTHKSAHYDCRQGRH